MSRLCDGRRCSQGFCGACAGLDEYGKTRGENSVSGKRNGSTGGTAFGRGDGGRNTNDENPWRSRKAVNLYTCVRKSRNAVEVRGSPPKTACSVRGTSPPTTVLSARGTGLTKAVCLVRGTSPPKAVLAVRGASPPKPTLVIGEEGLRSPPVRRR